MRDTQTESAVAGVGTIYMQMKMGMSDDQIDEIVRNIKDKDGVDILKEFGGDRKMMAEYVGKYIEALNKHINESLMNHERYLWPQPREEDKSNWLEMNNGNIVFGEKV